MAVWLFWFTVPVVTVLEHLWHKISDQKFLIGSVFVLLLGHSFWRSRNNLLVMLQVQVLKFEREVSALGFFLFVAVLLGKNLRLI